MTSSRGWRLAGVGMCAIGVLLAGCDGGGGTGEEDSDDPASPLAEFLGWDDEVAFVGEDQEFTEEERQQHYDLQEYVVDCMEQQGFEYNPEPFWGDREDLGVGADPMADVWQLQRDDPEAFAKEYGYGITTIDYETETPLETPDPTAHDPNHEYRESLSAAAREEYEKALWGDFEELEGAVDRGEDVEFDPAEIGGCYNEATDEVYGFGSEDGDEQRFEDLWEEMESLEQRIQDDPRMAETMQSWSTCMADAGYPGLEEIWDGQELVSERQGEVYNWDRAEGQAEGESGAESGVDPAVTPTPFEPVEPDPEELAALREFELEVAWADYECKREHDVEEVEREVRFEQEEQFIEDHREELEAYRDWLEDQGVQG